jgi:hypothetical protein
VSHDVPAWVSVAFALQGLVLVALLVWLSRGRKWRRLRVGFFVEKDEREEDDE